MFDETKLYRANDPALKVIASRSRLAQWRCDGTGPAFIKLGPGPKAPVAYTGKALNEWLAAQTIQPTAA